MKDPADGVTGELQLVEQVRRFLSRGQVAQRAIDEQLVAIVPPKKPKRGVKTTARASSFKPERGER